ncbi:MAG: tRNA threonylcarbamoyladenosine biosynthesis protein TsaB [Syntrophorhabdus sp. PtaU1.Bin058]|nr:MAG: tRNA threonylcarbamoyladenosine biosynthesis protein TsaB [Syntrophorhabdus sp. PtaU1.Bin058]
MENRLILGIDNSLDSLNLVLAEDYTIVAERRGKNKKVPSEILPVMVSGILTDNGHRIDDITNMIVTLGPGSFTGIRVALAFCKGINSALNIPITGVPTLDALSFPLAFMEGHYLCPLIDAKKGEVFCALYKASQGNIERITGYHALKPGDIPGMVKTPCVCFGTGTLLCESTLAGIHDVTLIRDRFQTISGEALLKTGLQRITGSLSDGTKPIYGRRSEAEIKFNVKLT